MKTFLPLLILHLVVCLSIFSQTKENRKITSDELVSKHLASIGSDADLKAVKSRVMIGNGTIMSKLGFAAQLSGPAQFAAQEDKVLFAIVFDSSNYPYEKIGYDGKDLFIGFAANGNRSALGDFLKSHEAIFKKGLFGGALSSDWALLDLASKKAKIEYAGMENIADRKLYKFKYNSAGSLNTSLYFEPDTFRHVMSEYEFIATPRMGATSIENARQKQRRFKLTEKFSDFRKEGNLTLPHKYMINLTTQEENTRSIDWVVDFLQFVFNEPLEAKQFRIS